MLPRIEIEQEAGNPPPHCEAKLFKNGNLKGNVDVNFLNQGTGRHSTLHTAKTLDEPLRIPHNGIVTHIQFTSQLKAPQSVHTQKLTRFKNGLDTNAHNTESAKSLHVNLRKNYNANVASGVPAMLLGSQLTSGK